MLEPSLLDQVRGRWGFTQTVQAVKDLTAKWPQATAKLVEEMGGEVVGARFAIELASECGGRDNLKGYDVYSAIVY